MVVTKGRLCVSISSENLKLLDELRFKNNKNWSRSALLEKILKEFLEEQDKIIKKKLNSLKEVKKNDFE